MTEPNLNFSPNMMSSEHRFHCDSKVINLKYKEALEQIQMQAEKERTIKSNCENTVFMTCHRKDCVLTACGQILTQ